MKIQIIRKKASSLRELGREERETEPVSTLRELLETVARAEFEKQHGNHDSRPEVKSEVELREEGRLGKVQFGEQYNDTPGDWEKALGTLYQDFEDGLYRVYVDGAEYTELNQAVSLREGSQIVFIRLVMLSGRLW